jgi:hypothetical protein
MVVEIIYISFRIAEFLDFFRHIIFGKNTAFRHVSLHPSSRESITKIRSFQRTQLSVCRFTPADGKAFSSQTVVFL